MFIDVLFGFVWNWGKQLFCNHDWDKTHGYYGDPVAGARCNKCRKVIK